MTRIPYTLNFHTGKAIWRIRDLHAQYGPFVRLAPDIVSVSHPDAHTQLQGHRTKGKPENPKDEHVIFQMKGNIIGANREDHSRFRRAMSHGFSAQAREIIALEQQPMIKRYVDLLLQRMREHCHQGRSPLDVTQWYNWATFDIVGDLASGEPFDCLEEAHYHPGKVSTLLRFEYIGRLLPMLFIPRGLVKKMQEHTELSAIKVEKRLGLQTERADLIGKMVSGSRKQGIEMSKQELVDNAALLIIAGSETTAVLLSGATYLLAKHRHVLERLQVEVCSSFSCEDEIDLVSTQKLKYLQAVLDESLRYYPPAVGALPRVIAPGGDHIVDRHVPGGTVLEVWQWVLFHNTTYFHKPDEFRPEPWLGDEEFKNDALAGVTPFSVDPRNCIGKNLAYAEMRLILARIVWNFDFSLAPGMEDWYERCEAYTAWKKPALGISFIPRAAEKMEVSKEE
ncbi:cytochrome P450 [Apiospora phragmitis]|uniref:Cytochrome P450 n=1 Tax=Apiospora phragmitis TaxID=2905665 RepID=A0ABR1WWN6_9PEZI